MYISVKLNKGNVLYVKAKYPIFTHKLPKAGRL